MRCIIFQEARALLELDSSGSRLLPPTLSKLANANCAEKGRLCIEGRISLPQKLHVSLACTGAFADFDRAGVPQDDVRILGRDNRANSRFRVRRDDIEFLWQPCTTVCQTCAPCNFIPSELLTQACREAHGVEGEGEYTFRF